jgi:fumarylacetoacetase
MSSWVPVPDGSDFPIENLPFGVVAPRATRGPARCVVRIGDHVLDLAACDIAPELTARPSLDAVLAAGPARGRELRARAADVLVGARRDDALLAIDAVDVLLPFTVGDYVDFYSSLDHATNLGRILRPNAEPLLPNWRHLPVGYHGRAGTVVVSGTPIPRPEGLVPDPTDGVPRLVPSRLLDFELEVGFVVGGPSATRLAADDADAHVFGGVLLNDWSARDIQSFEYQPLGPNLAKSFATTISPWVVTLDALAPYLVAAPLQDPEPDPYLRASKPWAIDLHLEVDLDGTTITSTSFASMYWTFAQQLAHVTVNGATTKAGDLFGSGTVSGPTKGARGSMIELTWRGAEPLTLGDGSTRAFLEDGDTVTLRGWCEDAAASDAPHRPRIGFGECTGTITPTPTRDGRTDVALTTTVLPSR